MAPPGRFKSSIVGTDLPLVGTGFEWSLKQISRKRRFGPPRRRFKYAYANYCLIHLSKRLRLLHPNSNLWNMTKLILLDSLFQEVRVTGIQIVTWLIWSSLHWLIHFCGRCVSSDNSLFSISWVSWYLFSLLGFESSCFLNVTRQFLPCFSFWHFFHTLQLE